MLKRIYTVPLALMLLSVGCHTPSECMSVCDLPSVSILPSTRPTTKDLAEKQQSQATTQWHMQNQVLSPDGKWALGYQHHKDRVTFHNESRYYATRTRSAFGLLNLSTQVFMPLPEANVSVHQAFWLSENRYMLVVRPDNSPSELREYTLESTTFERKAQAQGEDVLQAWHVHPWLLYQNGEQLIRINLETQAQTRYGPMPNPIEQVLIHTDRQKAYLLTQPITQPDDFRIQLTPPLPQKLYVLDFATGHLQVVNPPEDLSYHGVHLSLSPESTRLLVTTSMTAYGQGMTSFVTDTRQALYAADVQPMQLLQEQKASEENASGSSLWPDQIFWRNEHQLYSYRKESALQLMDTNAQMATTRLSSQAIVLGMNASHQLIWLDKSVAGRISLKVHDGQNTRELKTWSSPQTVAYTSYQTGTHAWFDIEDGNGRMASYVMALASLELQNLPLRDVQPISDKVDINDGSWYVDTF